MALELAANAMKDSDADSSAGGIDPADLTESDEDGSREPSQLQPKGFDPLVRRSSETLRRMGTVLLGSATPARAGIGLACSPVHSSVVEHFGWKTPLSPASRNSKMSM
jgi:hypothetical protein